jgi:hypothetical protein
MGAVNEFSEQRNGAPEPGAVLSAGDAAANREALSPSDFRRKGPE